MKATFKNVLGAAVCFCIGASSIASAFYDNDYMDSGSTGWYVGDPGGVIYNDDPPPVDPGTTELPTLLPSADASATVTTVIARDGLVGRVVLDGSRSFNPWNDYFWVSWTDQSEMNSFSGDLVMEADLSVGIHVMQLWIYDVSLDMASWDFVTIEIITPHDAVDRISQLVTDVDMGGRNKRPLIASLMAARDSIDRGNLIAAVNQLKTFQNKVRVQISDPVVADELNARVEQIVGALAN